MPSGRNGTSKTKCLEVMSSAIPVGCNWRGHPSICAGTVPRSGGATRGLTSPARQVFVLAIAWLAVGLPVQAGDWKYVVPAADAPAASGIYPVAQAFFLSSTKPEDLRDEDAPYRGKLRRYAQLRYGSPNSIRVSCVIDELDDGTADLYVDANRNRTIENRGQGRRCRARTGRFPSTRRSPTTTKSTSTAGVCRFIAAQPAAPSPWRRLGFMEGTIALGDKTVAARRVDGDANGSFADAADRLWIDRNADGVWDPFTEQFAFATILRIGGQRYAARSDTLGDTVDAGNAGRQRCGAARAPGESEGGERRRGRRDDRRRHARRPRRHGGPDLGDRQAGGSPQRRIPVANRGPVASRQGRFPPLELRVLGGLQPAAAVARSLRPAPRSISIRSAP